MPNILQKIFWLLANTKSFRYFCSVIPPMASSDASDNPRLGSIFWENGTFRECSSLQKIEIPANVTSIGSQCFYLCQNLKEVNFLGTSIKSIDKGAFKGCYSLERIMLPSSMLLVGERCFEGCSNIREIHSESINPPFISENAFNDIYDFAKLYVPVGSIEKYAKFNLCWSWCWFFEVANWYLYSKRTK